MSLGLSSGFESFASALEGLAQALPDALIAALDTFGQVAVREIQSNWPVDTGYSRDRWRYELNAADLSVRIVGEADYSSYVFEKGDDQRVPLYPEILTAAFQVAADESGLLTVFQDMTEEYIGQGRTTSHLTGSHRKRIRHAPVNEQEGWRKNHPDMIEEITVVYNGIETVWEVVPSDTVQAGQMGSGTVRPRRR